MTYGRPSRETSIALTAHGFDGCHAHDDDDAAYRVSVIVYGALDEEFDINDLYLPEDVGQCVAGTLENNSDLDEWEVMVTEIVNGEANQTVYQVSRD